MTNNVMILIYTPLIIINLILLCAVAVKREKVFIDKLYIALCLLLGGWQVFELLFFVLPSPAAVAYVYTAKFAFATFIPPCFFLLVLHCYRLHRHFPRWVMRVAALLLCSTVVITLVPGLHGLFRTNVEVLSLAPLTRITADRGVWYYINLLFTQLPVAGIAIIVFRQHNKLPKAYRSIARLLLAGLSVYAVGFVVEMVEPVPDGGLDINLMGVAISNFLFYIAVYSNGQADYLNIWRRDMFNLLEEAVLIIDPDGSVIDANRPAVQLFEHVGVPIASVKADALLKAVVDTGEVSIRHLEGAEHTVVSEDLYITSGGHPVIYEIHHAGVKGGQLMVFTEVTRNRLAIERLQGLAGVDPLTNLQNRFVYEQALQDLDQSDQLPISVIVGDVNGLKALNDTQGHQAGDMLLTRVAAVLQQCCPENGITLRIGGDEFVMLLPLHTAQAANAVIARIYSAMAEISDIPYEVSIALGSATKTRPDENMNLLIQKADYHMYADKKTRGRSR